jgi:phosphoribosyl-ATP pyrophosphohydrolase/phosphoribosyl-AMP cyclohydrolase
MTSLDPDRLDWAKGDGLLPAVVQDAGDGAILMLGYMNREALAKTLSDGQVVFYSRSRRTLWRKGETSGNVLDLVDVVADCDSDTLRIRARPAGPTCHLGTRTCFGDQDDSQLPGFLGILETVIRERLESNSDGSYVASLAQKGRQRIAQKVGEEGVEFALACAAGDREGQLDEAADLLFHLMVALANQDLSLSDIIARLETRHRQ